MQARRVQQLEGGDAKKGDGESLGIRVSEQLGVGPGRGGARPDISRREGWRARPTLII
jgi:hypothetical protein